jgi:hypothetical protein
MRALARREIAVSDRDDDGNNPFASPPTSRVLLVASILRFDGKVLMTDSLAAGIRSS